MEKSKRFGVVAGYVWKVGGEVSLFGTSYKIERMYDKDVEDHEMCIFHAHRVTLADLVEV